MLYNLVLIIKWKIVILKIQIKSKICIWISFFNIII